MSAAGLGFIVSSIPQHVRETHDPPASPAVKTLCLPGLMAAYGYPIAQCGNV